MKIRKASRVTCCRWQVMTTAVFQNIHTKFSIKLQIMMQSTIFSKKINHCDLNKCRIDHIIDMQVDTDLSELHTKGYNFLNWSHFVRPQFYRRQAKMTDNTDYILSAKLNKLYTDS